MRYDAELLQRVEQGIQAPTLRFFRFNSPTVSFGRLQKRSDISHLVPADWSAVQRPTGGGVVFHQNDLCYSLAWKSGQAPLPARPQDQYRWTHSIVLAALNEHIPLRMAACCDVTASKESFVIRTCFQNPVGYDLMQNQTKIVGGALRCTRQATLYQGSIQIPIAADLERKLERAFLAALTSPS